MAAINSESIEQLAMRCREHEQRYRSDAASDPQPCYDLFRVAFTMRSEEAWSLIYDIYEDQVLRWIRSNSVLRATGQPPEQFVNLVFARFWQALSAEKFKQHLNSHASVLLYLKRCVMSVLVDYTRERRYEQIQFEPEAFDNQPAPQTRPVERRVSRRGKRQALWQYVIAQTKGEQERIIVEQAFALERRARHIQADFPELFPDMNSVYRTKENLIKRLRRDDELKDLFYGEN